MDILIEYVDSAYNINGYKGQPVIAATEIMPQNLRYNGRRLIELRLIEPVAY